MCCVFELASPLWPCSCSFFMSTFEQYCKLTVHGRRRYLRNKPSCMHASTYLSCFQNGFTLQACDIFPLWRTRHANHIHAHLLPICCRCCVAVSTCRFHLPFLSAFIRHEVFFSAVLCQFSCRHCGVRHAVLSQVTGLGDYPGHTDHALVKRIVDGALSGRTLL